MNHQINPFKGCFCLLMWAISLFQMGFSQTNTLVTGVLTDQNGQVPNDPLEVRIYSGNRKLATVKAREGLFHSDLKKLAASDEVLTIEIKAQSFELGKQDKARKYGNAETQCLLQNAQNLQLIVQFEFLQDQPETGPFPNQPGQ
jgi:hypothetical protein